MLPELSAAQIEVQQPTVEHTVSRSAWWKWLERTGVAPREMILRKRIRELLK